MNTINTLPVCPICGGSKGFAKGYGRRITATLSLLGIVGQADQSQCSLDGLDVAGELQKTATWWQSLQKSAPAIMSDDEAAALNPAGLLACANTGCRIDFEHAVRRMFKREHGHGVIRWVSLVDGKRRNRKL
jgi:hypothetical protein